MAGQYDPMKEVLARTNPNMQFLEPRPAAQPGPTAAQMRDAVVQQIVPSAAGQFPPTEAFMDMRLMPDTAGGGSRGDRRARRDNTVQPTPRGAPSTGSAQRRASRGQSNAAARAREERSEAQPGMTPRPDGQVFAVLPELNMEQQRRAAAEYLSNYNMAELQALQGIIPQRAEPQPIAEQAGMLLLQEGLKAFDYSQRPEASMEEAAAGQDAWQQLLMSLLNPPTQIPMPYE